MTTQSPLTTLGEIRFSHCGEHSYPLFRVNADVPINDALEHASPLLHLAKQFTLEAAMEPGCDRYAWAAHYLAPAIGRTNRVYEVLNGKRALTLPMIWKLHQLFGIPAESLIKPNKSS